MDSFTVTLARLARKSPQELGAVEIASMDLVTRWKKYDEIFSAYLPWLIPHGHLIRCGLRTSRDLSVPKLGRGLLFYYLLAIHGDTWPDKQPQVVCSGMYENGRVFDSYYESPFLVDKYMAELKERGARVIEVIPEG